MCNSDVPNLAKLAPRPVAIACRGRSARMKWERAPQPESILGSSQIKSISFEDPDDYVMPEEDYVKVHGDPGRNGRGHSRISIPGCERGVLMPGPRIWKVRKAFTSEAKKTTVEQRSSDPQLGEGMLEANFQAMQAGLSGPKATGQVVSLDLLLGRDSSNMSPSSGAPGAEPPAQPTFPHPSTVILDPEVHLRRERSSWDGRCESRSAAG